MVCDHLRGLIRELNHFCRAASVPEKLLGHALMQQKVSSGTLRALFNWISGVAHHLKYSCSIVPPITRCANGVPVERC